MANRSSDKKLQIKYLSPSSLKPDPKNPRIHSKKQIGQIAKSISRFTFLMPVLVSNKNIIAGHGRVLAAQKLGLKTIPVIEVDHLSPNEIKTYMIADNKLTENSKWHDTLLREAFLELSIAGDLGFELDITGFETSEIDLIIEGVDPVDDEADIIPEVNKANPVTKIGDIWEGNGHRIICADSLDPETYAKLLNGKKAQMIFTDPPYNVPVNGHVCGKGKIKHREFFQASGEMSRDEFIAFLQKSNELLCEHSVDGSIHYLCIDWRHIADLLASARDVYSELKNICIWNKDNGGMGTFYRNKYEMVAVFKNGKIAHINNFELGQNGRYRTNVWDYPGVNSFSSRKDGANPLKYHPTVKPVQMVADAIYDCSKRSGIILDNFLGSGTTLLAAERTGRICCGVEIDPVYVDVAITRWQNLTGKDAINQATGKTFNETKGEADGQE